MVVIFDKYGDQIYSSSNDDSGGGGIFLLIFLIIIIGIFVTLLLTGNLNKVIPFISDKVNNAPHSSSSPSPTSSPGSGIPTQAGAGSGNQQTITQQIMADLGANAGNIIAAVGVDIAADLAKNQKSIAKYIMKRGTKVPGTKLLFEKAASKAIKKTFTGRIKNVFSRLSSKAAATLGARWTKTAVKAGQTAARIEARAAALAAERGAAFVAQRASLMAAKIAAKEATVVSLGPVGWAYDAITVVSIGLDVTNAGNYAELTQTSDLLEIKKEIDRETLNVNLACSSIPPTADCPIDPDAPPAPVDPDETPMPGRYPSFFGPLDKEQTDDYGAFNDKLTAKVIDIVTTKPYTAKVQALFDKINVDFGASLAEAFRDEGVNPDTVTIPGITDAQFSQTFLDYWTDADSDYFYDKALDSLCTDAGGVTFSPGAGYEKQCTYKTEETCHAQYPWPAPADDSQDLTYTEWRAKNWFRQFKNTDGTNTLDMDQIPEGGACIAASNGLHLLCDQEMETGSGKAKNEYRRNTGECYNSREVCRIKGVSYTDAMEPAKMANLTDHSLPSCYVSPGMQACENIVGVTICRALQSGGDVAGARGLVNLNADTGSAVGDAQVEGLAAAVGTAYLIGREGLMDAFSSMLGGQQTYAQIQQQLDDTAALAGSGLNNLASQADGGSVTAALALPSAAILAGVSLGIAAIGSAFSALDTAVTASRTQNYPAPVWCRDHQPSCRPGEHIVSTGGQTWDSCEELKCNCEGVITNGICCPEWHTGSMVNGEAKCTPMPYPSWWNNFVAGSCTKCWPDSQRETHTNVRTEIGCYDKFDGYTYDYSYEEYVQVFTNVCEPVERYDTVYTLQPGGCESATPQIDPRAFGSRYDYCASAKTAYEISVEAALAEEAAIASRDAGGVDTNSVDNTGGYY